MRRVLHLVGSAESEFFAELSRLYAAGCLAATADCADAVIAHVSPGGDWRFPASLTDAAIASCEPVDVADAVARIVELAPDAVVPQMFCLPGMTVYRSLFDVIGIPYLGNRGETMALTAHKARAKAVVAAAGVSVPDGVLVRPGEPVRITPPVVVKPVDGDNSIGVTLIRAGANAEAQLEAAVWEACEHSSGGALVERYVELGREVRCGVLQRDGKLVVLPLEEYAVSAADKPIRGAADKLARGGDGRLGLVAKDADHAWIVDRDDPVCGPVRDASLRAYDALGCRHYGLFDFRIDPDGRPWFLEAGLYCSFAPSSVVAVMAEAAGIGVPELFETVLEDAIGDAGGAGVGGVRTAGTGLVRR